MNKKLLLITSVIYLSLAGILYISLSSFKNNLIKANIYPLTIHLNESIYFSDSTENASSIIWEFGNGETSRKKNGEYIFKETGKYKVRLTINEKNHQTFLVTVAPKLFTKKIDSSIKILADISGIVNQKIHFKALGENISWCEWHFTERGKIESRALETFYSFDKPGRYEVYLITNLNFNKPQKHIIEIKPQYKITENIIVKPKEKSSTENRKEGKIDDLKRNLQKLTNSNDFNDTYNLILKKYLCGNAKIPVSINGGKTIDFYSYCQSIQISSNVSIKTVTLDINSTTNCPIKIIIVQ